MNAKLTQAIRFGNIQKGLASVGVLRSLRLGSVPDASMLSLPQIAPDRFGSLVVLLIFVAWLLGVSRFSLKFSLDPREWAGCSGPLGQSENDISGCSG